MSIFFAAPIEQSPSFLATSNVPVCATADASYPASNLATKDPTQPMMATGPGVTTISWDFGQIREWDVLALIHTTLPYTATWKVEKSDNGSTWTDIIPSTSGAWASFGNSAPPGGPFTELTDPRRKAIRRPLTLWHGAVQSSRHARVQISWPGQPFTIGRMFVGKKFTPSTGWQYGSSFNFLDPSLRERTDRGALLTEERDVVIAATVKMEFLTKQEMLDYVWEFNYWRGASREILACLDTDSIENLQKNTLYCDIVDGRQITFDSFNTHSQTWILESIA